jgi:hypothetical protein
MKLQEIRFEMGRYKGWRTWWYPFRKRGEFRWQAHRDLEGIFAKTCRELLDLIDSIKLNNF